MTYDVIIVGAGPAGCSAAIHLAGAGHTVLLLEKQRYPAHKLCGEFLSVEVMEMFARLGVAERVRNAGAHAIERATITAADGTAFHANLPGTAYGLSRYALDHLLFRRAVEAGAEGREGTSVRSVRGNLEEGFEVRAARKIFRARCVLGAYGKRSTLDRKLERPFLDRRSPYVAFKAHYAGRAVPGTVTLHAFRGGYCGIQQVEGEHVNVCWIAHERVLKSAQGRPEVMIERVAAENGALARDMRRLQRTHDTFLAVSQVAFRSKGVWAADVCMLGDTAGMIGPMCGDGMGMALRSAELAAPYITAFLEGNMKAGELRDAYERAWLREFRLRMMLGRWLHHGFCRPRVARLGLRLCRRRPGVGRFLIEKTRG